MPSTDVENPDAGQAAVVLDIGGDIGALVVEMPANLNGIEVEIVPTGTQSEWAAGAAAAYERDHAHQHDDADQSHKHGADGHAQSHDHDHDHPHQNVGDGHAHSHAPGAPPHVAVVERPLPAGGTMYSLVYGELTAGTYDLYVRPDGPVQVTAEVSGGEVTFATWPGV